MSAKLELTLDIMTKPKSSVRCVNFNLLIDEGNWREGGGRVPSQPLLSSEDLLPHTVSHGSAADSDAGLVTDASKHSAVQSPVQFRGPMPVMPVRPGMPPPPPHLGQMSFLPPNFRHPMMMQPPFVSSFQLSCLIHYMFDVFDS